MRVPQGTLLPPNPNLPLQNKKMRFVRSKRSKFTKNCALAVTLDTWKRKAKRVFRHAAFYARPANYIHNIHTYYMTGANHQVFASKPCFQLRQCLPSFPSGARWVLLVETNHSKRWHLLLAKIDHDFIWFHLHLWFINCLFVLGYLPICCWVVVAVFVCV